MKRSRTQEDHSGWERPYSAKSNHLGIGRGLDEAMKAALQPVHGKVRTFADMTPDEREHLRRLYQKGPR